MTDLTLEAFPHRKARAAGASYVLAVLVAIAGESLGGQLGYALGFVAIALMLAMTLLVYGLFKPVNRSVALLAVFFSLVGLGFEALRWNPRGVDIALVFHACFCFLIGYLALRASFLPRILGALMILGGCGWLTHLSPPLADRLSPYNVIVGFLGDAPLMLWLLALGVSAERWKEQASAAASQDEAGAHF